MAGSFTLFGTCLTTAFLLPAEARAQLRRALKTFAWSSFLLVLVTAAAWFLLQTADMAAAQDFSDVWCAIPIVAAATRFGELLIARTAAAFAAILLFQFGLPKPAALIAGLAVIAEAWLGHGGAMTGPIGNFLLIASVIHLASGSAWLGSLPALRLALKHLPIANAACAAKKFSPLGIACVLGLTISAAAQFFFLVRTPAALFNNSYGLTICAKILLLLALIALAAANRTRLTPALSRGAEPARAQLLRNLTAEIALGLLVLLAAGLLLQLTPPTMAYMLNPQ
jgi:putative copper resistance protein D